MPGSLESQSGSAAASRSGSLGKCVYAGAAIFLGIVGLIYGDFATPWQHSGLAEPLHRLLAYFVAAIELGSGIALLSPRTARAAALVLTAIYAVFTVVWLPVWFANVRSFDPLGNFFEEFSLVVAGAVLVAWLSPAGSTVRRLGPLFARLYGLSAISFGVGHIVAMPGLLTWIPAWLPPSRMFWAYVTTIGFFLAAAAILTGIMAPLASRLITAEIVGFEILVWIPKLVAGPRQHFNWGGNGICIALAGAAWVVSDSICRPARRVVNGRS
jgi:uncharacterized membrane protein YphA (DoxX/SURF4 family)